MKTGMRLSIVRSVLLIGSAVLAGLAGCKPATPTPEPLPTPTATPVLYPVIGLEDFLAGAVQVEDLQDPQGSLESLLPGADVVPGEIDDPRYQVTITGSRPTVDGGMQQLSILQMNDPDAVDSVFVGLHDLYRSQGFQAVYMERNVIQLQGEYGGIILFRQGELIFVLVQQFQP
jgi:hypothetical protein